MPSEKKYNESCSYQSSHNVRQGQNLSKSRQVFKSGERMALGITKFDGHNEKNEKKIIIIK